MIKQANIFSCCKLICLLLLAWVALPAAAQDQITVKGFVQHAGKPLENIRVSVDSSFVQTQTDSRGYFTIEAEVGDRLVFSAAAYRQQTIVVESGEEILTVSLEYSEEQLVSQVGYSERKKAHITAAVSEISGDIIAKTPVPVVNDAIQGNVSGLTVVRTSGNEPGWSLSNFYVRGLGTFGYGRSPLFIVDNVERDISQLDPEEIETFTILKDAAAVADFGIRAANGVIKVKTKRGHTGRPIVGFNANFGLQTPAHLPEYLGAQEYVRFRNIALANDGLPQPNDPSYDPNMYDGSRNPFIYPDTDWYGEFIRKVTPQQMYRLSVDGGSETVRYYVSLGVTNQAGIYNYTTETKGVDTNPDYSRYNVRANTDIDLSKYLTVSLDLGGKLETKRVPNASASTIFTTLSDLPPVIPIKNEDGSIAGTSVYTRNPYGYLSKNGFQDQYNRYLQGNVSAVQKLDFWVEGLSAKAMFSFDTYKLYTRGKSQNYAVYQRNTDGTYSKFGEDGDLSLAYFSSDGGYTLLTTFMGGLEYKRQLDKLHYVEAELKYLQSGYEVQGNYPKNHQVNLFGHATYAYDDRYTIEFGYSYSGSEDFRKGKRFGFFPVISGAWTASNESFFDAAGTVNLLKLRASYGLLGNSNLGLGRFPYMSSFYSGQGYIFGDAHASSDGSYEGILNNPNITFEKSKNANIGIDIELFDRRLAVTADVFRNDRSNIITDRSNVLSGIIGQELPYENLGSVLNKGFEVSLTHQNRLGEFAYYTKANVSFARNKITHMEETEGLEPWTYKTGYAIDVIRGLEAVGFFSSQEEIDAWAKSTYGAVSLGDIKYKDQNNDNIIDDNDMVPMAYSNMPEWNFGLTLGASYKNVDLSMLLAGVANRTLMFANNVFLGMQGNTNITKTAYDTWQQGVNEATAQYPRLTTEIVAHNMRNSTIWSHNGNYLKMQNLEIGYNLPQSFLSRIKIMSARVFLSGYNLFSFDKLKKYNVSAEYPNAGITAYPEIRVYNIGLNVKF